MTTRQMLETLQASLEARLPGWTVYPYPVPTAGHRQATMAVLQAHATPFRLSGPGVQGIIQAVLTVSTAGGPDTYYELMDALDAAVLAVYDAHSSLIAGGVEVMEPGAPEISVAVDADGTSASYWRLDFRIPFRRML